MIRRHAISGAVHATEDNWRKGFVFVQGVKTCLALLQDLGLGLCRWMR